MSKRTLVYSALAAIGVWLSPSPAKGWGCSHSGSASGSYGGSVSHSSSSSGSGYGSASHSGSTTATAPDGQSYSGSHSSSASYSSSGATYHASYSGSSSAYHSSGSYYGYHGCTYPPPTTCSGSTGGAFAAGMVTGAFVGAAAASAKTPAPAPTYVVAAPTYVYPTPGVYVSSPTVMVAAPPPVAVPSALPLGSTVPSLPAGFLSLNVGGIEYYQSGPNWYQVRSGANGAYYVVVPVP